MSALDIFELRPLIKNFGCKLSTISSYDAQRQLLCLVSEENDIVLRYISATGQEVLKMITWFRRANRVIHDVCFDPAGVWLLVLCFDNTLHIVPALAIVDKTSAMCAYPLYSTTQVTSYIIPFVGPHECPNSKKCPNHSSTILDHTSTLSETMIGLGATEKSGNVETGARSVEPTVPNAPQANINNTVGLQDAALCQDLPSHMLAENEPPVQQQAIDATGNSQVMASSFMASKTCPYPLSVVWWKTNDSVNRAIIGYSDGAICFVALSPNCPFVASTAIDSGSVVKLLICKDNTFDSVMLLITSSLKQQYKLLLEQKAIMYVYPGDISPSNSTQQRDGDWQIVMPVHARGAAGALRQSNSSDPASDSSQLEEDVFVQNDDVLCAPTYQAPPPPPPLPNTAQTSVLSGICENHTNQMPPPPPPPYSVAVKRQLSGHSNATATTANVAQNSGTRIQPQQELPTNTFDSDGGILPAARARLASLKSLGTKKLQAIKLRLSDNRQRCDEYVPEANLGSFAIMDSPSVTPEPLGSTNSSFYTVQNLRSTYLLSALHSQSNSLTVHSIDINLKPLFLYKIPKHCLDILISSNILYAIQYVDLNNDEDVPSTVAVSLEEASQATTEKENRDTDIEKIENLHLNDAPTCSKSAAGVVEGVQHRSNTSTTTTTSSECTETPPINAINAVSVISSAMASIRTGDDDNFNACAQMGLFRFENETVLRLYQMAIYRSTLTSSNEQPTKEDKAKAFQIKDIETPMDYVQFYETAENVQTEYSLRQMEIMQNEFPKINYDPCYVVTNKNVYYIQLKKEPFEIFLDAALASEWTQCRDFCNTFDLSFETCIEFAGDYLLRRKKVTQALLTYNVARVKPIRTALKLAMYGHTYALMQLCALALKSTYILRSQYLCHPTLKTLLEDATYRHSEDVRYIIPKTAQDYSKCGKKINTGAVCGDYTYGIDESISALQMSPSSQFHLANLLLITLAEKAVNDKNYIPLWNFLVINSKYHTNMTSIVLCQSGLFSSALVLAKVRGVCLDTFLALTSVVAQEFGWYTELNVCLYNLSERIFIESITYLPQISMDYFVFLQEKLEVIRPCVLSRLAQQLNPFAPAMRPVVSHTSMARHYRNLESYTNDNNTLLFEFCKSLIETYLAVLIHMESQRGLKRDSIINALSNFRITYEDNQFAIDSSRFKLISAGCAHCACIVDGVAYFWGSNGVPCCFSATKSSDPPEPPHAVKSLDLLSQLNLEVHAVKCGRQHTLLLTNNGVYAMGNNNLWQLGIGRHMQMALQPMLVRALDGKNITILEAGQYHNAAVADGQLYMWGWGAYGQLGHGNCENSAEPQLVSFFKYKKILQVSLGHAHSLVLCKSAKSQTDANNNTTELFVFGSNHFGQLGIGQGGGGVDNDASSTDSKNVSNDPLHCATQVKCILPVKLEVSTSTIRLIHTKFFTNIAVDENERMYTWGSSPQALRLANQIRRRANAKQKLEENQQREMSRRLETSLTTTSASPPPPPPPTSSLVNTSTSYAAVAAGAVERKPTHTTQAQEMDTDTKEASIPVMKISDAPESEACDLLTTTESTYDATEDLTTLSNDDSEIVLDAKKPIVELLKPKPAPAVPPFAEVDPCEHMTPHLVDTTEVAGQILQISSGLFHFALISSSSTLYTWGKNLEHQLGTEDKERRPVNKPSPIDSVERPMYVDCGADFTLVMTVDYVVKAFGGNSNGQCGRDLGASIDRMKQRVVCLPTTKRLMRFESQCVEAPVEINLPRPRIRLNADPVRYLKCIPRYQAHFMQEAAINFEQRFLNDEVEQSLASLQYKSSSENAITGQESDDLISSIENLSNNDASSLNYSYNATPAVATTTSVAAANDGNSSYDCSPEEQSYAPLAEHEHDYQRSTQQQRNAANVFADDGDDDGASTTFTPSDDDATLQPLRHYIHYCLYAFHGLYHPDKIRDFAKLRIEYRIRTLMLNFKFVDAFRLCLQDCDSAQRTLKIFEYFSKDTGYVPMRRQDLKYLIYHLCLHFLERKFDMLVCERYFQTDLDYYLLELAYVLFFNNNNTMLEQTLNQKFKTLMAQEQQQQLHQHQVQSRESDSNQSQQEQQQDLDGSSSAFKLQDTDAIFDSLSVKFKTLISQRLLKYCGN